jgi:hypothetical protein
MHGSGFVLVDPTLVTDITGSISFDRPPDTYDNPSGFPDFFEVSQPVRYDDHSGVPSWTAILKKEP